MRRLLLLLVLPLALAACDSGGADDELAQGRFEAEATGRLAETLKGRAVFDYDSFFGSAQDPVLVISMAEASFVPTFISFLDIAGQITGPGTYTISPEELSSVVAIYGDLTTDTDVEVRSGTLTVDALDDDQAVGSFELDLFSIDDEGGGASRVTGRFNARPAPEATGEAR